MKFVILSYLFFFLLFPLQAQESTKVEKWSIYEDEYIAEGSVKDPFHFEFGAVFTHESDLKLEIPGFYNGNNYWLLRFSPSMEGRWFYKTFSSLEALSDKTATIIVVETSDLEEHGPLIISPENVQRFSYADSSNYFLMAFELDWLFALDWDNPDDIPKTKEIISEIKEHGFNQVIMNVYAYDASWGDREKIKPEYNFSKPTVYPFLGTNENPDFSELNIDFFKHLDRVMEHLDDQEIVAHLMIYVWNKKVSWPEPSSEADNMYFDYVVKRYQAYPNLVWDISKEALAYGRDELGYISERIDRLRNLDGHVRLLTVHDYLYCSKYPEKVDFISIQDWKPNLYDAMMEVARLHSDKPVFNIEHGGYEATQHYIFHGAYSDPLVCLDRNYQCVFAGTYSTYYWQNTSWYEVIYNPSSLPIENQPKLDWYKRLKGLFLIYDFEKLEPVQYQFTPYCLTDHKSVYMFYIPEGMELLTGEVAELKGKSVNVKWFDPLSGNLHLTENRTFDNGIWLGFTKPDEIQSPFAVAILEVIN
ncbi:MAG: DUF5060 domain-containing protein [Bacteroidales bacterium]|nr:DUF5060 domain-containing protein [Bacteroidales bacterium]